jgi:hypothetical protein
MGSMGCYERVALKLATDQKPPPVRKKGKNRWIVPAKVFGAKARKLFSVRRRVFCNRRPDLRFETAWWVEDAELLVLLFRKKKNVYICALVLVCHLATCGLPS